MPKLKIIFIIKDKCIITLYSLSFEKMTQTCWSFHLDTEVYVQITWKLSIKHKNCIILKLLSFSYIVLCSEINIKATIEYSKFEIIFQISIAFIHDQVGTGV